MLESGIRLMFLSGGIKKETMNEDLKRAEARYFLENLKRGQTEEDFRFNFSAILKRPRYTYAIN